MNKQTWRTYGIISILFIFSSIEILSQTDFYYSRDEKIPMIVSKEAIVLKFKDSDTENAINTILSSEPVIRNLKPISSVVAKGFFKASLEQESNLKQLVDDLKHNTEIEAVNNVYLIDSLEAMPFDQFIVQFEPSLDSKQFEEFNKLHNVEVIETNISVPYLFRLRITQASDLSVVDMAKLYYESLPAIWSLPDFIMPVQLYSPNDTYFSNQYYLNNTGQTGGTSDADIDALEAWSVSVGSASITIAVIDEGGSSHQDIPSSRIVPGYDYFSLDTNPDAGGNEAHGMACGGIIAASQNNSIGISGIAPNCKLMYLRIFSDYGVGTSVGYLANAIDYAWQHGADILSNSWGFGSSNPNLWPNIVDAINRALTQGRGGKGCAVVFAAGNTANRGLGNYGYVSFPACVPGVLAVGATDKSNNIQYYSPRDSELGVVAPSGDLGFDQGVINCSGSYHDKLEIRGDVWSLDIGGQPGWNDGQYGICPPTNYIEYTSQSPRGDAYPPGNYTSHFGGTSAACPQVSGIAALILSINSNLTQSQVINIIKLTADDMGNIGYDTDFGYGRVNAYKAVLLTQGYGNITTNTTWYYDISAFPWEDNLTVNTGVNMTVKPGVEMQFDQNAALVVNGKLTAIGTSQNKITFGGGGLQQWWDGIIFNDASDNSSQISYAIIYGAVYGIKCYKANPTITWNRIATNQYGVHVTNAAPTIRYNYINQNVGSNYTGTGIYVYNGLYPNISNNRIFNNTYGIQFVSTAYQAQFNDNDIYDNQYNFFARDYTAPPFVYSGSGNNFYFLGTEWYDVGLRNGACIDLFDNWWDEWPPDYSEFDVDGTSALSTSPELMSPASHTLPKRGTPQTEEEKQPLALNKIKGFKLFQNYPNPFNPSTVISYQLPVGVYVSLKVFDILGREVSALVNKVQPPGNYKVTFDALSGLSSGIYFYVLKAGEYRSVNKMIYLR